MKFKTILSLFLVLAISVATALPADAASKKKIDKRIVDAMAEFHKIVDNSESLLRRAEGVLIFPNVKKGGIGLGFETGQGALMIGGKKVQYYRMDSPSIGLQLGFQVRRQIFLFLDRDSLNDFRNSENWEIGVDGSVALVTLDAGGEISSETLDDPVIAFVYGSKGLMYNLSLEGTKFSKITPK